MPLPISTTATTGPNTSQGTTSCQPKCKWTEWFDVDFPTSGVMGGDIETYDNIRAAGGKMCQDPEKIECRAENYPEVSIDQIGQVLSCSLETGLVCRNEDQRALSQPYLSLTVSTRLLNIFSPSDTQRGNRSEHPSSTPHCPCPSAGRILELITWA